MTSINGDYLQTTGGDSGSIAALQNQLANLQRQCADWQSCATTPEPEKQKIVAGLSQQIAAINNKIEQVQRVQPVSPLSEVVAEEKTNSLQPPADGTNRPSTDPFATSGSVINTSI